MSTLEEHWYGLMLGYRLIQNKDGSLTHQTYHDNKTLTSNSTYKFIIKYNGSIRSVTQMACEHLETEHFSHMVCQENWVGSELHGIQNYYDYKGHHARKYYIFDSQVSQIEYEDYPIKLKVFLSQILDFSEVGLIKIIISYLT
jgi:hypothetical protein